MVWQLFDSAQMGYQNSADHHIIHIHARDAFYSSRLAASIIETKRCAHANVALVKEAVALFGPRRVTWTNTGCPRPEERKVQGLPDYVALRDGGIRAIYDGWFGSCATNWTLASLVAKGALAIED